MINISLYIIEKLHLNKNISTKKDINYQNKDNVYLMFTLVQRYQAEKYIVPDIVEIVNNISDNTFTYKCLTNYHNQKNNEETIIFNTPSDKDKGYKYESKFVQSRNMIFIEPERGIEIINDCKNRGNLCWKQLFDKNYKISSRNAFYDVYLYNENTCPKLRKNSYGNPTQMEKLNEYNGNKLIDILEEI